MKPICLSIVLALALTGCDSHDHDHDHEHDHGSNGHHHEAPHGGALVVFGDEFAHVEFVLDAGTGGLTAYVLDGAAEKGVRISQVALSLDVTIGGEKHEVTLAAQANELSGEKPGDTSQFAGRSDALEGVSKFDAEIEAITVKGQKFESVAFKYPEGNE